jgi:stage V sporulation protein B
MYPTAISQIIEALGKLFLGVSFAWYLKNNGYPIEVCAAGAVFGMTLGTVIAMVFLILRRALDRNPPEGTVMETRSGKELVKSILAIAIPITIGSGLLSLTNTIDSLLVMRRLQTSAGFILKDALFLSGSYSGLAQTMFNFPAAFIMSFSVSIVPAVAAAMSRGDNRGASRTIETAIRLTSILALPAAAGLSVLAWPILNLLFSSRLEEVNAASLPLTILGIAVFFNCVVLLTNAVLQSIGKARIPVYTMLIGSVIKITANWFLVGTPSININGAPIGTCLCYFTIMFLNLAAIFREVKPAPNLIRMFGKPLIAAAIMSGAAWAVNGLLATHFSAKIAAVGAIAVAGAVYLLLAVLMKLLTPEDLRMLPKGDKIARILRIK